MRLVQHYRFPIAAVLTFFICSIVYISHLPWTVQMGDTGELVSDGYNLFVAHPPGYPLFTLLVYLFTHGLQIGTVFWRAALMNQFFSSALILLLLFWLRKTPWMGMGLALLLATSRLFWKFSVLPEVFILNGLIAAGILTLYFERSLRGYRPWISLLFFLGLGHHLTIVFMFPVVAHALYLDRRERRTWLICGLGVMVAVGLYCSLMQFHPTNFWSWGEVNSLKSVWRHFIRADYGTFKLVNSTEPSSFIDNISRFWSETWPSFVPLVAVLLCTIRARWKEKPTPAEIAGVMCLSLYLLVFFGMSNLELIGFRIETFDRFSIFPQVLICFLVARLLLKLDLSNTVRAGLVGVFALGAFVNYVRFSAANNFSKNSIIEDYALKLLHQAPSEKPVTLWTISDTRYNALLYTQQVLGVRKDIVIVHPSMLFFRWYALKAMQAGLVVRYIPTRSRDIDLDDFVTDNLQKFTILATTIPLENSQRYHITYLKLGQLIEPGTGVDFAPDLERWTSRSKIGITTTPTTEYDVFRDMWNEYGIYHFKKADRFFVERNYVEAKAELLKSLALAPWSQTTKANLCVLAKMFGEDEASCRFELFRMMGESFGYY